MERKTRLRFPLPKSALTLFKFLKNAVLKKTSPKHPRFLPLNLDSIHRRQMLDIVFHNGYSLDALKETVKSGCLVMV